MMILVVESNKEERSRLKRMLSKICQVITLSSMNEALAFLRCQRVDVLLISVEHRSLTSKNTVGLLHLFSERAVLIYAMPEEDSPVEDDVYINRGFSGVLRKPALFPQLVDEIFPLV